MDLGDEGALQTLMDMVESDSDRTVRDTIRSLMESRNPDAF
jgi:hypothetical protein